MFRAVSVSLVLSLGFVLGLFVSGCDGGDDRMGEPCGDVVCGTGQVCCNPLAGICTAPGEVCAQ